MIGWTEGRDEELDRAAVDSACRRYLVATRTAAPEHYLEVEDEAWLELVRVLSRVGRSVREHAAVR